MVTKVRNIGVDLLRTISMFMVVVLHVLGQGGLTDSVADNSFNYFLVWFFECACFCSVDCYALISGYVGYDRKRVKLSSIATLWLEVALYSVITTTLFHFLHEPLGIKEWVKAVLPVTFKKYWYFTAYFAMWWITPLLNKIIETMDKKVLGIYLVAFGVIIIPVSLTTDAFLVNSGYGVIWLTYLYLLGAYIGKNNLFVNVSKCKSITTYIICVAVTFALIILFSFFGITSGIPVNYVSPFILISAISLLSLFSKINVPEKFHKVIVGVSSLTFGVYLIHTHPLVFKHLISGVMKPFADSFPIVLILVILMAAISIFAVCILIDYSRMLLFRVLRVKTLFDKIETIIERMITKFM